MRELVATLLSQLKHKTRNNLQTRIFSIRLTKKQFRDYLDELLTV